MHRPGPIAAARVCRPLLDVRCLTLQACEGCHGAEGGQGMGSRQEVLARLNAGDAAGAARIARDSLAASPENADVQGLLSLALEDAGDKPGALDALRRAVALPAAPSIALRNIANLAAMLVGAG